MVHQDQDLDTSAGTAVERHLDDHLGGRPLSTEDFLALAVPLAELLARLHREDVFHRDIRPATVAIHGRGPPRLLTSPATTVVDGLHRGAAVPPRLLGDLAYLAPEETGRMNRLVDQRADLYSLGATFYQMLTGAPPFASSDSLELVHAHLARAPAPPARVNPAVPPPLSALILKLLAKIPEHRYQSAEGLAADLRQAAAQWEAARTISPFELDLLDLARQLPLPARLYQREGAQAALHAAWRRAASGARELLLVTAPAGGGKTALVNELRPLVEAGAGRWAEGKFDLQRGNRPYAALGAALGPLVEQLVVAPRAQVAAWRRRLEEAVGRGLSLLVPVIPPLERLLGGSDGASAAGPLETENRFRLAFAGFMSTLTGPERPLALFLDDLQWSDPASLRLLTSLAAAPELEHLLLIGAYRPEGQPHLDDLVAEVRAGGAPVELLDLPPLTGESVTRLVADLLRCEPERARPLAAVLVEKTAGNPFSLGSTLRFLQREHLLVFDPASAVWSWDLERIEALAVTDNVVDLLLPAQRRLPAAAAEALGAAASLGNRVTLGLLATACGQPPVDTAVALRIIVREGLLAREEAPDGPDAPSATFRFVHDRIQQAALALLDGERRAALHLRVGRALWQAEEQALDDRLFTVIDHLHQGAALLSDPAERLEVARLSRRAAGKARAASAYRSALEYLQWGRALLPADAWTQAHDLAVGLHQDTLDCALVTGDEAVARAVFDEAMSRASALERANLIAVRMAAGLRAADYAAVVPLGLEALALLQLDLGTGDRKQAVAAELTALQALLARRTPEDAFELPLMQGPEQVATMKVLTMVQVATYFTQPELWTLVTARLLRLTLEHGNTVAAPSVYISGAFLVQRLTGDYVAAHAWGRMAVRLAGRLGDPGEEGRTRAHFVAAIQSWVEPFRDSIPLLREGQRLALAAGDLLYAVACAGLAAGLLYHQGIELGRVLAEVEAAIELSRRYKARSGLPTLLSYRAAIHRLRGQTAEPPEGPGDEIVALGVAVLFGEPEQARALSISSARRLPSLTRFVQRVEHAFYTALAAAGCCAGAPAGERPALLAELAAGERQLATWAANSPENFRARHLLVAAELARLEGRDGEAGRLYDEAIEAASHAQLRLEEALGSELCGRFHRGAGRRRVGQTYLEAARQAYGRWGAAGKAAALLAEFPALDLAAPATPVERAAPVGAALDQLSLFRAAETISSEVVFERLLERLMEVCLATAGASRGALVLEEEGGAHLRAVGSVSHPIVLLRQPLEGTAEVARAVIEEVRRDGQVLVLDDASRPGAHGGDPYLASGRVRALMALPIRRQARLIGVLSLENELLTRVFDAERVRLLQLLSSQIAISLENSLLFEKLNREIEQNARLHREARAAVRLRDDFLSTASHELNTPLAALQLAIEAHEVGGSHASAADLARLRRMASRQVRRLRSLVDELLSVARIEAGHRQVRLEPVELGALVETVLDRFADDLQRARCPVELQLPAPLVGRWDRERLEQILAALLSNAQKFGPGRPITIIVQERPGARVRLTVQDRGIGIPLERLPHIFGRFERAVPITNYGGLGLGLYLAYESVLALAGSIRVESAPGEGARFIVELPRESPGT